MHYTYDKLGRIISKTDGQGYTLSYAYDCMGRVLSVSSSTGQKKTYTYDALGNVTSMTDANGNTTKYEYTLSGRLKTVTDALGNRAEYAYDDEDRLIHICQKGKTEEKNRETFYERNALGQVERIRDAFGNEEHYSYDALGRTIIKTDRDGYRTEYGYTSDGKIKIISYGDGTSVEMEYTALRQLALIRDWLGEIKFRRDDAGNPTEITDHKGRTVAYEWGSMGERRSITYPDGNKVIYEYDEMLRLQKMQIENRVEESPYLPVTERTYGRSEEIHYKYDSMGRIAEKLFPEGMCTRWLYDEKGQLTELVHEDRYGILDRYQYEYDLMGNKTAIIKERRGLKEESGRYEYSYDGLSRLISVSKDKDAMRCYEYDSFGNRSYLEDFRKGRETFYHYDTLNRLMFTEERQFENILPGKSSGLPDSAVGGIQAEGDLRTDYVYDNRGNMIREEVEGKLIHGYEYGAMNRLSRSWNDRGQEAVYLYNGLGQRTGKSVNGEEEDYLLDLTRGYHNLLDIQKEERGQRFYFDGNVTAMEETGGRTAIGRKSVGRTAFPGLHYYMQDELGSPLRVSGYRKKEGSFTGKSEYLTYGYDEFGNDLGGELEEAGIPSPYDRQGVEQPFGYTGYRYDEISGTYFAQAREYQPGNGRFTAEDVIKGNGVVPWTLNQYNYCRNTPVLYIDVDGRDVWYFYDPETFRGDKVEKEVEADIELLEEKYNTEVHTVTLNSRDDFIEGWNKMDNEKIDAVIIYTHANPDVLRVDTIKSKDGAGEIVLKSNEQFKKEEVNNLESKNIETLVFLGCNTGLTGLNDNMATRFIDDENIHNIRQVIAADGSVSHKDVYITKKSWFTVKEKLQHTLEVVHGNYYDENESYDGYKMYYYDENNNLIIEKVGYDFDNVVDLINRAEDKRCSD